MEQYDIIIALHTRGNAAAAKTQKTNHHAAAAIMAKACTVAGVAEVTDGNPDLALRRCQGQGRGAALAAAFGARPWGHQSLIVAETGRADRFVCEIAREGQEGFRGKDGPAQEDEAARTTAERRGLATQRCRKRFTHSARNSSVRKLRTRCTPPRWRRLGARATCLGTSCCPRGMSAAGVRHRPKKSKPQQRSAGARARGGKDEDTSALFDS